MMCGIADRWSIGGCGNIEEVIHVLEKVCMFVVTRVSVDVVTVTVYHGNCGDECQRLKVSIHFGNMILLFTGTKC